MSEGIVDLSEGRFAERLVDVCVVGSGPGGATAARLLASRGLSVVVLEEGADQGGVNLPRGELARYDQLYSERGGRTTDDLSVSILHGKTLGGGAVINACDVVPMPDAVKRHWATRFGLVDFSPEALARFEARALEDLSPREIPESEMGGSNVMLRRGTEELGWRGEIMRDNRRGCVGFGQCLIACPVGAKKTPRVVAIPAAIEHGATFLTRARAVRIVDATSEVKTVDVRALDPFGRRERDSLSIRARVVVLAANPIGTVPILLRSGLVGPHLGRHVSLQPQLPVVAIFDDDVRAYRGIPQAYAVTEFERIDEEHGLGGFRIEGIMGTPGIVSSLLPVSGIPGKESMASYRRFAAALCLVPDAPTASIALENDRPKVRYVPDETVAARLRDAARAAARAFFAAGARRVLVPVSPPVVMERPADVAKLDGAAFFPARAPLLSAHQQGGARMATSPKAGVTSPEGAVHGMRDVFVLDSSTYPSSSSSHTMTPILTTAHALAVRVAGRLGR